MNPTLRYSAALALGIIAATATPGCLRAQDPFDARSAGHVRDKYVQDLDTVSSKILALAEAIPADKYSWRPATGVRSISEAFMHVAGEYYFFTPMSLGGKAPADFGPPREALPRLEKITTKAEVIAELRKSWAHCRAQMTGIDAATLTGDIKPWGHTIDEHAFVMTGDLHEHLGQLIAYARSGGVKPPWSK
jgi:uncharacterized damage-inducible protein DinB